jgi:hypothetical protein
VCEREVDREREMERDKEMREERESVRDYNKRR